MSELTVEQTIEAMNSVLNKMEDILNTQQSLIGKVAQVEIDLLEIKSPDLDKRLEEVHTAAANSYEVIKEAIEDFEIKRNQKKQEL